MMECRYCGHCASDYYVAMAEQCPRCKAAPFVEAAPKASEVETEGYPEHLDSIESQIAANMARAAIARANLEAAQAPLTERFTAPDGQQAIRYLTDDTARGIAAGSELYLN